MDDSAACSWRLQHSPAGAQRAPATHAPHARVSDNADGHAGAEAGQAAGQPRAKVGVAVKEVVCLVGGLVDCGGRGVSREGFSASRNTGPGPGSGS